MPVSLWAIKAPTNSYLQEYHTATSVVGGVPHSFNLFFAASGVVDGETVGILRMSL